MVKDAMRKAELEKKVKHSKTNFVNLTRTSKVNHYNNYIKENKLNLLKRWSGIYEIINTQPKETIFLQFNNTTITDSKLIANLFNNHFPLQKRLNKTW